MNNGYKHVGNGVYIDHYAYDRLPPEPFGRHMHNEYELLYILSGDITYVIEDRKYKLKKHDLVVIRPQEYHVIQTDSPTDYERHDILFSPSWLGIADVEGLPPDLDVINCRHHGVIRDLFKKFDYYVSTLEEPYLTKMAALLIQELVYNLSAINVSGEGTVAQDTHPLIAKALAYINDNLFSFAGVADLAQRLYVTESYLYRVFKQELKTTPLQYVIDKRLLAAQTMLLQGDAPSEVYRECGFRDYTSFYRHYVKAFGVSPSQAKDASAPQLVDAV